MIACAVMADAVGSENEEEGKDEALTAEGEGKGATDGAAGEDDEKDEN